MLMCYRFFRCECLNNTSRLQCIALMGSCPARCERNTNFTQFVKAADTRKPENPHPHQLTYRTMVLVSYDQPHTYYKRTSSPSLHSLHTGNSLLVNQRKEALKNGFSGIVLLLCWPRYECDIRPCQLDISDLLADTLLRTIELFQTKVLQDYSNCHALD